jgi:uncharacterized membrane protein (UPF0136 family)
MINKVITGYSLLLLIGGVIGYFMAGSLASLLMSSIFAILLIGSLFLDKLFPDGSFKSILFLLGILILFFAYRWYVTKFFPAGAICVLSVVVLITTLYTKTKSKKA